MRIVVPLMPLSRERMRAGEDESTDYVGNRGSLLMIAFIDYAAQSRFIFSALLVLTPD
jgi:hypothetical protein